LHAYTSSPRYRSYIRNLFCGARVGNLPAPVGWRKYCWGGNRAEKFAEIATLAARRACVQKAELKVLRGSFEPSLKTVAVFLTVCAGVDYTN
jgi:hypothetical protein